MSVLGERPFRRFWVASFAGEFGNQFALFALSVTAVVTLGADAAAVGAIVAAGQLPWLLSLAAGVGVDRWRRRPVLLTVSAVRVAALVSVFVAYGFGVLSIVQLVVVSLLLGVCEVFALTAHDAFVRHLVGRDRVSEARARLEVGGQTATAAGPAAAGQIVTWTAGPVAYGIAALIETVSFVFLALTRSTEPEPRRTQHPPFWTSLATGARSVLAHPLLRLIMVRNALVNLAAGAVMAILPLLVLSDLGLSPATFGLTIALGAIAGIAAGVVAFRLIRAAGELRVMLLAPALLPLGIACFAASGSVAPGGAVLLVGAGEIVLAASVTLTAVAASGVRAKVTPESLMGRVSSASRFVTMSATPLGALIAGAVGVWTDHFVVAWCAAAVMLAAALVGVLSPLIRFREVPAHLQDDTGDTDAAAA